VLVAVALAATGVLAWRLFGGMLHGRQSASAPQAAAPPVVAAVPAVTSPSPFVTLAFTSEPQGAEVRGPGGELYGVTPFSRAFPRSDDTQALEVTRSGYAPVHLDVTANAPRAVSVRLSRLRKAAKKRVRHWWNEITIDPFHR
jgi:hypothetical protein